MLTSLQHHSIGNQSLQQLQAWSRPVQNWMKNYGSLTLNVFPLWMVNCGNLMPKKIFSCESDCSAQSLAGRGNKVAEVKCDLRLSDPLLLLHAVFEQAQALHAA
jgi:hypothetical protein